LLMALSLFENVHLSGTSQLTMDAAPLLKCSQIRRKK
jgi:hypothetical protein